MSTKLPELNDIEEIDTPLFFKSLQKSERYDNLSTLNRIPNFLTMCEKIENQHQDSLPLSPYESQKITNFQNLSRRSKVKIKDSDFTLEHKINCGIYGRPRYLKKTTISSRDIPQVFLPK